MAVRPVLVGMNNPHGAQPQHALWPLPERATGWRVWRMIDDVAPLTMREYADGFDRRNLLPSRLWSRPLGRGAGPAMRAGLRDRVVVVLGAETWTALHWPHRVARPPAGCLPTPLYGGDWYWLPHPSGRCRWYNDPANRRLAGELLARLLGKV